MAAKRLRALPSPVAPEAPAPSGAGMKRRSERRINAALLLVAPIFVNVNGAPRRHSRPPPRRSVLSSLSPLIFIALHAIMRASGWS
ncbi:hypothetical protein P4O66_022496 [Electrophorus voltai]|uniref:Uncharacterized protein n=1 Tax=Electrophorus voltai TaxID=2609070 RepID=A0AAD9E2F2_9TELE|nr:hypothetical protein P4O66_022496 [Electrophorus voltai]